MHKRIFFSYVMLVFLLSGCSTLLPEQNRQKVFSSFINQTYHWFLYWPSSLINESVRLGSSDLGKEFSEKYDLEFPVLQLMRDFNATAGLSDTKIVNPKQVANLSNNPYQPVFYFVSSWELIYQRIPPNLSNNKLRMGVIAKVIPLGQVLEGKGPIALRTAAWEGRCTAEAFDGKFFNRNEWEANNGTLLKQGLQELQKKCGVKLAEEFKAEMMKY